MRPDRIVMTPPAFDDDLSFSEGVEDLAIEQLIAKAGVEALDVAILPRTAGLDIGSLGADGGDPSLDSLGDELRSVVGVHRGCGPRQSRRTRRDCGAAAAAGCTIRRPATACFVWVVYWGPSAPRVARCARPACR